jgi:hypothetical protein
MSYVFVFEKCASSITYFHMPRNTVFEIPTTRDLHFRIKRLQEEEKNLKERGMILDHQSFIVYKLITIYNVTYSFKKNILFLFQFSINKKEFMIQNHWNLLNVFQWYVDVDYYNDQYDDYS